MDYASLSFAPCGAAKGADFKVQTCWKPRIARSARSAATERGNRYKHDPGGACQRTLHPHNRQQEPDILGPHRTAALAPVADLPSIPVLDVGPQFAIETLERDEARAHALIDDATRYVPHAALKTLDAISRKWLVRWGNAHLPEIDEIARRLARPGAYFLSVNYEWGCTCQVAPAPDAQSARLMRVLDWRTPGLGRNVMAARVASPAGRFVSLGWPGYTGVLQAVAPGRFAAALNQAPMRRGSGLFPLDWAANRRRVWKSPHPMPAHLLRTVFETATTFAEAKAALASQPISSPAIFSLAGVKAADVAIIERTERHARVHDGPSVAANHWQACGWRGTSRGVDSAGRARLMRCAAPDFDASFAWLTEPVLNPCTRLAMVGDARSGRVMARGYEREQPATAVLDVVA